MPEHTRWQEIIRLTAELQERKTKLGRLIAQAERAGELGIAISGIAIDEPDHGAEASGG
jgi:hypothetical protein